LTVLFINHIERDNAITGMSTVNTDIAAELYADQCLRRVARKVPAELRINSLAA